MAFQPLKILGYSAQGREGGLAPLLILLLSRSQLLVPRRDFSTWQPTNRLDQILTRECQRFFDSLSFNQRRQD